MSSVCQTANSLRGPLRAVYEMDVGLLAKEHKHHLILEQQGHLQNVEAAMVAALDMFQRMALRGMGLVDRVPAVVAEDADGKPLFMDSSMEVMDGLAFFKPSALLSDIEKSNCSLPDREKSNCSLPDSGKSSCSLSDSGKSSCSLPDSGKSSCSLPDNKKPSCSPPNSGKSSCGLPDSEKSICSLQVRRNSKLCSLPLSKKNSNRSQPESDKSDTSLLDTEKTLPVTTRDLMRGSLGEIGLMCDYCLQTYPTEQGLRLHMNRTSHPTGSTVLTVKRQGRSSLKPRCVIVPGSVQTSETNIPREVPVCPVCLAVFGQIADCVRHTYTHGGITGVFQLRKVNYQRTLAIMKDNYCCTCYRWFPSVAFLIRHWHRTKHLPLVTDHYLTMFFCCWSCGHFSSNYEAIHQHVLHQHKHLRQMHGVVGLVRVVYLEGPTPIRRLLPFFPVHHLDLDPSLPRRFIFRCESEESVISYGTGGQKRRLEEENFPPESEQRAAKMRKL